MPNQDNRTVEVGANHLVPTPHSDQDNRTVKAGAKPLDFTA